MKTDNPLKRLDMLCSNEMLRLLWWFPAVVLSVKSVKLPMMAKELDVVFHLRSALGQEYFHIVEFQGYPDEIILWRTVQYAASFGRDHPGVTVLVTIIYLNRESDQGNTIVGIIDGQEHYRWSVQTLRLWEYDAQDALTTGILMMAY